MVSSLTTLGLRLRPETFVNGLMPDAFFAELYDSTMGLYLALTLCELRTYFVSSKCVNMI